MGDWPGVGSNSPHAATGMVIHSMGWSTPTGQVQNMIVSNATSAVYTLANYAIYIPFVLEGPRKITRLAWYNGTVVSGNADCGVYTVAGTRLLSTGSTAQSGTSTVQIVDTADLWLAAGTYYLAFAMDNITATVFRGTPALVLNGANGAKEQSSAFPLPSTATFAVPSRAYLPAFMAFFHPSVV